MVTMAGLRSGRIVLCCLVVLLLLGLSAIRGSSAEAANEDPSSAFLEAAQELFDNKGMGNAFMQSEGGKAPSAKVNGKKPQEDGLMQIISGLGSLVGGQKSSGEGGSGSVDYLGLLGSVVKTLSNQGTDGHNHGRRSIQDNRVDDEGPSGSGGGGLDFDSILNMASMFMGQKGNAEGMMGFLPLILDAFTSNSGRTNKDGTHDHSDHSWYMPPIIEKAHVMWDHFSNSELGQTLWKNSGLTKIVDKMTNTDGKINWEMIMESLENPTFRKRWISSLTNFVAEWMSHVSDPVTQQRYLVTAQFVANSFLKSQGYPKSVMFDVSRPADSLSMLVNAVARRHLNMRIDSYKYIKPAVAYAAELMNLASEKGFIMSRINARDLSSRLRELINLDLINPVLRTYRVYKYALKEPHCAAHVLCSINQKKYDDMPEKAFRQALTKIASFPTAWAISNKSNVSFWSLYGSILESDPCEVKFPVDCSDFHEEEFRVTTEFVHSDEL